MCIIYSTKWLTFIPKHDVQQVHADSTLKNKLSIRMKQLIFILNV